MRMMSRLLLSGLLGGAVCSGMALPASAAGSAAEEATSAVEDFSYPNDTAIPGITLTRGDGRIELVDCVDGGAGLLRVRSSVRKDEFCFDVKGPGGYLALELQKTYQLRGDGEHSVEAEVTVNGVPREDPVVVPDSSWTTLPVVAGQGNTLVELRSADQRASGTSGVPAGAYPFVTKVHVGDAAEGGRACTGALLDAWWVVTAKQCFAENGQPVVAGAPKRASKVTVGRSDVSGPGTGVVVSVARVVPHPERDVVLVKLAAAVDSVAPVKVATTAPTAGEVLRVAGFGRTASAWAPDAVHTGAFTVSGVSGPVVDITGQDAAQVGPCKGDAGGPGLREAGGAVELVALTQTAGQGGCRGSAAGTGKAATQTRVDDLGGWFDEQFRASTINILIDDSSKKCLAMEGASTEPGKHAIQWACSGAADQDWQIRARAGGRFEIRNDHSDMCLAIAGGVKDDGAHMVQWPCRSQNPDQFWQLSRDTNGFTELKNMHSGLCLAIEGNSKDNGGHVLQWPCRAANIDQNWQIKARSHGAQVRSEFSGLCVSNGGSLDNRAHVIQQACTDANDREWQVRARVGGYAEIRNDRSGQCLSIDAGSKDDRAHVVQWPCAATSIDQQWYVDIDAGGMTQLRNGNSDKCLAIVGGSKDPDAHLLQWPCNVNKDQLWRL